MAPSQRYAWKNHARIIGAVAGKDIIDALRNRTTLSIVLGVSIMMMASMALPALLGLKSRPTAIAYDPHKPSVLRPLTSSDSVSLRLVSSEEDMRSSVAGSPVLTLGLRIPEGFPGAPGSPANVAVPGYVPHWAQPTPVATLVAVFEAELSRLAGRAVRIETRGNRVYPPPELDGQPAILALNMVLQILIVGLALVPYLLVEEKETRTLDALTVSPAGIPHVLVGKALAGFFYCLCGAGVVAAFSARWIVHWELALLAALLGAAISVGFGLWLGALCDNPSALNLWMSVVLMFLLGSVLLTSAGTLNLPAWAQALLPWTPAVALTRLLGLAMAGEVPVSLWSRHALILGVQAAFLYVALVARMRRMDR